VRKDSRKLRRVVVPVVLAVSVIGTVAAISTTAAGCGDHGSPVDASVHGDAPSDTPIV
jgi:hypothetical protein